MATKRVSFFDIGNDWGFSMTCEIPQGTHEEESQRFSESDLQLFVDAIKKAFGSGSITVTES